jgi:hypothetical protein
MLTLSSTQIVPAANSDPSAYYLSMSPVAPATGGTRTTTALYTNPILTYTPNTSTLNANNIITSTLNSGFRITPANNIVLVANPLMNTLSPAGSPPLGTPTAGTFEYTGYSPYFTPYNTARGVIQASQYYALNNPWTGNGTITTAQTLLGSNTGFYLASGLYEFEGMINLIRNGGATSHTISIQFTGTSNTGFSQTIQPGVANTQINYQAYVTTGTTASVMGTPSFTYGQSNSAIVVTGAITTATYVSIFVKGMLSIPYFSGTFNPSYVLSAAPGGAYVTQVGSYFKISPIAPANTYVVAIGNIY